jgi:transposase
MKYTTVGVDIAQNVFQLHWVDASTGEIVNGQVKRAAFLEHFVNCEPCLIGMEACGGSQRWGRRLTEMGHQVRRPYAGRGAGAGGDPSRREAGSGHC